MKRPKQQTVVRVERSAADRMFFRLVTAGWHQERVAQYADHMRRYQSSVPDDITEAFKLIDGKATGLLTHVSLMIAGLGLVAPLVASDKFEIGVVVFEIAVYLLIAVGCLRCLAIFNSKDLMSDGANLLAVAHHELIIRRELYALCNRSAIWFTVLVFLLLPILFLYEPTPHL